MASYRADKVQFTDGRTDRRTNAGNDNTHSAWNCKGQNDIQMESFDPCVVEFNC